MADLVQMHRERGRRMYGLLGNEHIPTGIGQCGALDSGVESVWGHCHRAHVQRMY